MKPVDLQDHPEGGRYREVYRSALNIVRQDGQQRTALTHIYFSLASGELSRFHRVQADEVWNLYRGQGLWLYTWDGTEAGIQRHALSADHHCFCHVVPAGIWQAAEPMADKVLVGCSVAPGFDFSDFDMMDPDSAEATLLPRTPLVQRLIGL